MTLHEAPRLHGDPLEKPPFAEQEAGLGISIGWYLPETVLTNQAMARWGVPGLTIEKIGRVGVKQRYVAGPLETVVNMGIAASLDALEGRREVDWVFFSTSHPDGADFAQEVATGLKLSTDRQNLINVHAACSGVGVSLAFIKSHEQEFLGRNVLIVASERYSPYLYDLRNGMDGDPSRSQTIFSDGAFAIFGNYGKDFVVLDAVNHFLGEDSADYIRMAVDPKHMRGNVIVQPQGHPIPIAASGRLEMQGPKVLREIGKKVPQFIKDLLEKNGLVCDVTIVPHQASGPVLDLLGEKLPESTLIRDIEEGNFSSASGIKALAKGIKEGKIRANQPFVLATFGAGLFSSIVLLVLKSNSQKE